MRAFDPEVVDAIWAAIEPLVPVAVDEHPLACHRARTPDRDCFEVMLVRLVTGCSWADAERAGRARWYRKPCYRRAARRLGQGRGVRRDRQRGPSPPMTA